MAKMTYERDIREAAEWSFETPRFFVGFFAEAEDVDPADSFTEQDDVDAVRNGDVEWFCAVIHVYLKDDSGYDWQEVGADYLGGCAYKTVREFWHYHTTKKARDYARSLPPGSVVCDYFPGMVREALRDARNTLHSYADVNATLRAT